MTSVSNNWMTVQMLPAAPGLYVRFQGELEPPQDDEPILMWLLQRAIDPKLAAEHGYYTGQRIIAGIVDTELGEIQPIDAEDNPTFERIVFGQD